MDGTLLDSMPVWEHASERYLQNKGIKVRERLSDILFSMSMQKGAEYVKENYHLAESVDEIVAGVNNIVYTAYEKEVQPKEGVRELLDTLQVNGIKMAVATSTDRPMVEAALKRTGLFSYFEQIFTCTEVGKEQCYVFDFAPDRTLKVIAETAKISSKAGKTSGNDRKIMGEFLNFCPIELDTVEDFNQASQLIPRELF